MPHAPKGGRNTDPKVWEAHERSQNNQEIHERNQNAGSSTSIAGIPENHAPSNQYKVNSQGIRDFFNSIMNNDWNLPVLFFGILINQNEFDINDTQGLLEFYEELYSGFNSLEQRLNGHPGGEVELLDSEKLFINKLIELLKTPRPELGWSGMSDDQIKGLPGGGLLLDLADGKADVPKSDGKKDGATELLAMLKEAEQRVIPSYGNPETLGTKVGALNEKRKSINDSFMSYASNYYSVGR